MQRDDIQNQNRKEFLINLIPGENKCLEMRAQKQLEEDYVAFIKHS